MHLKRTFIVWCWVEHCINVRLSWLIVFFNTRNNIAESQVLYAKLKSLDSKSFSIGLSLHLCQKSIEHIRMCGSISGLFCSLICWLSFCQFYATLMTVTESWNQVVWIHWLCSLQNCFDYSSSFAFPYNFTIYWFLPKIPANTLIGVVMNP